MANRQGRIYRLLNETSKRKNETLEEGSKKKQKQNHDYECSKCKKWFCEKLVTKCPFCKNMLCSDCICILVDASEYCYSCTATICDDCKTTCKECGGPHCLRCHRKYYCICSSCDHIQTKEVLSKSVILLDNLFSHNK